jgi:hypothetical protein
MKGTALSVRKRLALMVCWGSVALLSACGSSNPEPPTYTLGGTVRGLTGAGLVLTSNAQSVAVAASAAEFSFPQRLAGGSGYTVAVQSQPSGQSCSVASGVGAVESANVANVVVTCSALTFAVGGTMAGLKSSGLILANGADRLAVDSGASNFVLPTRVASGSGFDVTVAQQPAGSACSVAQGNGTVALAAVVNVAVSCTDQPFALGGTITGLSSTGLELGNGTDVLPVANGATQFTMGSPVAFSSAYAVTVRTQPTGLTCTVASGTGTMPPSAVTNVAVACSPQTYRVGGVISGLSAAGLQLANGSDVLNVGSGATSFVMPGRVAFAGLYAVTVATQPSGFTCTVANSNGTTPARDVTNVAVTCAPTTYTVGGRITGLNAAGLVLASGSDTVTVSAGAAQFTLPRGIASGGGYAVTIASVPANQLCSLSNATGTVAGSAVTNIQVTCTSRFSFATPGSFSWVVPAGVTSIDVVVAGGGGGGSGDSSTGNGFRGGNGAIVSSTLAVTPGSTLSLVVGGGGGASGGGASSQISLGTTALIVAGGGGGAGLWGAGGNGAQAGRNGGSLPGVGVGGEARSFFGFGGALGTGGAGGGEGLGGINGDAGGAGSGGAGGSPCLFGGASGVGSGLGRGGDARCSLIQVSGAGGAGGGGFGGGGGSYLAGGGGGGSFGPTGSVYTTGTNSGAGTTPNGASGGGGSIVITFP